MGEFAILPKLIQEFGYETKRHQSGKTFSSTKVSKAFSILSKAYLVSTLSYLNQDTLSSYGCSIQNEMPVLEETKLPFEC